MQTNRSNGGALIFGTLLIAFGLLSLADNVFRGWNWGWLWPIFVILFGGMFFLGMFAAGKGAAGLAIPGSIISGIGLGLLYQTITGRWEVMSYFWTMIILFVGIGIYIMGWYGGDIGQQQSGKGVMKVGLILFIIFGSFFEAIFSSLSSYIFPILLILLGLYLVVARSGLLGKSKPASDSITPLQ